MGESETIQAIGVCGLGQMGAAAAVCYKRAGYRVLLWDTDRLRLDAIHSKLEEIEIWMEEHVGPSASSAGEYETAEDLTLLKKHADLVMDCITEDMGQKIELFQNFHSSLAKHTLFITTTSGLSITEMGKQSGIGPLLVGTHFWNPPHLMPLVEVVRGEETLDESMDRVVELISSLGKIPVRVEKDVSGFIGNRLLHALWREAIYLVQEGIASPEDIDLVSRNTFGLRMPAVGPLENMDLVGLDLIEKIHRYLPASLCNDTEPLDSLKEKVHQGDLGMKTGKGFYDWSTKNGAEVIERRDRQIVHQLAFLKELDSQ